MADTRLDWPHLLNESLTAPGDLGDVYNRFYRGRDGTGYSLGNMMLFMMQGIREPVASLTVWNGLGRHLRAGVRGKQVIVPILVNDREPELPSEGETLEEKRERVARLIGFKVVNRVFTYSDTEGPEPEPIKIPDWDLRQALGKLAIREVPFQEINGNIQGHSYGTEFAINPMATNRNKTLFHEMAHIILGHTLPHRLDEYETHRGMMEFQAEATSYLVMNELELMDDETASHSRGYIKHWLGEEQPPDQAIRQVFVAADRILRAGRTTPISTPTPPNESEL